MNTPSLDFLTRQLNDVFPVVINHSLPTTIVVFSALIAMPLSLRLESHGWEFETSATLVRKRTLKMGKYLLLANLLAAIFTMLELSPSSSMPYAVTTMLVTMMVALNNILPVIPRSDIFACLWAAMMNLWIYQKLLRLETAEYLISGTIINLLFTLLTLTFVMAFVAVFYRLNRYNFFVSYGIQILSAVFAYQVIYWFSRFL